MHSSINRMWITTYPDSRLLFHYCYYCRFPLFQLTSGKRLSGTWKWWGFPSVFGCSANALDKHSKNFAWREQLHHFAFICFKLLGTISERYQLLKSSVNFCFGQQFIIIFGACTLYTWPVQLNFFPTFFIEECMTAVLQTRGLAYAV